MYDEPARLQVFIDKAEKENPDSIKGVKSEFLKNPPSDEDYGHYPKDLIFPFTKDRKVNY